MKTKTFDCLKMKAQAQTRRAEALEGLSEEERLDYYQRAHEALIRRQQSLRKQPPPETTKAE
jgi:hypothetical protein